MKEFKSQMVFKFATLLLVAALMMPTATKFLHVFNHHQHEICNGEYQTHLHKSDFECSFYKFKLSSPYTLPTFEFVFLPAEDNHQTYKKSYDFLSEFQRLHFSLRGPPHIDLV